MKNVMEEEQDGVKDADVMYQFKNMTYIYVDNVSDKSQQKLALRSIIKGEVKWY